MKPEVMETMGQPRNTYRCHRLFGEGPCPALPESSLALGLLHKSLSGLLSLMFSLIYGPFPFRSTLKFLPALYSDSLPLFLR